MVEKKKTTTKKTETKKKDTKKVAPVKQEGKKQAPVKTGPSEKPRIGVFICHCGTNIAGSIDIKELEAYAKTIPNVAHTDNYQYVCSTPGQKKITDAIILP